MEMMILNTNVLNRLNKQFYSQAEKEKEEEEEEASVEQQPQQQITRRIKYTIRKQKHNLAQLQKQQQLQQQQTDKKQHNLNKIKINKILDNTIWILYPISLVSKLLNKNKFITTTTTIQTERNNEQFNKICQNIQLNSINIRTTTTTKTLQQKQRYCNNKLLTSIFNEKTGHIQCIKLFLAFIYFCLILHITEANSTTTTTTPTPTTTTTTTSSTNINETMMNLTTTTATTTRRRNEEYIKIWQNSINLTKMLNKLANNTKNNHNNNNNQHVMLKRDAAKSPDDNDDSNYDDEFDEYDALIRNKSGK